MSSKSIILAFHSMEITENFCMEVKGDYAGGSLNRKQEEFQSFRSF